MFAPPPVHARSEVEKVLAEGQLFLECLVSFHTHLHLHVALSRRTNGSSLGRFKQSDALSKIGGVSDKNVTFKFLFSSLKAEVPRTGSGTVYRYSHIDCLSWGPKVLWFYIWKCNSCHAHRIYRQWRLSNILATLFPVLSPHLSVFPPSFLLKIYSAWTNKKHTKQYTIFPFIYFNKTYHIHTGEKNQHWKYELSLLYSNRFINSIEPHVKLVALRLPWWPEPGRCCCGIMIDYKTEYARHYLSSTILFFSFQKLIFESRQKIKLITSWQRHFIAGSLAKLAASLISLWARTIFAESYKNTQSAVPTRRVQHLAPLATVSSHLPRIQREAKWHDPFNLSVHSGNHMYHLLTQCFMRLQQAATRQH